MNRPDLPVVVAGLGALGSAAAWRLAERGVAVVGLDRYRPPHTLGSTHGAGRVIREGFFEAPFYVPLVRRAYEGWARLEELAVDGGGEPASLLRTTGALMVGDPEGTLVRGTLEAVRAHGIGHRVLTAAEIAGGAGAEATGAPSIPPGLRPEPHMVGVLEERAGVLHPERCVRAALRAAERLGADLRFETPLEGWEVRDDGVVVRAGGEEIRASALVLACGPWMTAVTAASGALPVHPREARPSEPGDAPGSPSLPLEVVRQVTHRFAPAPGTTGPAGSGSGAAAPGSSTPRAGAGHPAFRLVTIWEYAPDRFFYTVPEEGPGPGTAALKAAIHYGGAPVDPDTVDREVSREEVEEARALLDRFLPGTAGEWLESSVCLYTNTPDHHFVVGAVPGGQSEVGGGSGAGAGAGAPERSSPARVIVLGGGSGHAFKFAPALGELAAELVLGEKPFMDLAPFRPGRFLSGRDPVG